MVLTSMPGCSDALSDLEPSHALAYGDDISNRLMPRHAGEHVSEIALLDETVGMTDAAGKDFGQDVTRTRMLKFDISESQFVALTLKKSGLVGGGKRRSHIEAMLKGGVSLAFEN